MHKLMLQPYISLHILDMHIYTAIAIINYMPKEKEKGTGTYTLCLHFKTFILQLKKKKKQ